MCNCKKPCGNCHSHKPQPSLDCFEPCDLELYDAKDVRYKTKPDEVSQLLNLGIHKGEHLEYILELFGQMLYNVKYIESPRVAGHDLLNTYEKIIHYLFQKNSDLEDLLEAQSSNIEDLTAELVIIKANIEKLKYPEVTDDTNIGFLSGDSLETILQTIINNQ
jgi:hypothetical protein